ncbi:MAG: TIGR03013 family PEP-CTERM/XrtA system glycosyltransferase [Gammaproteobacteria bacterium]|nr:TIGR03013 family PEP-CTERM/XrtA system glycosyltransferase [Gammaproteobacteria bacterium]MCW9005920.1 TIGR03013 family PEP-CTERM/XrtA system glycosyltransferase [Gammaproteobacteria bacterium]MCW9055068.1 TIGR03013 family PEP-CTERM/XrtA system glycosyltransferase [Gammaproteobacteria bacterium]
MLRIFHHYIPTSIVWLIVVEFIFLFASVYLGVEIRFFDSPDGKQLLEPVFSKALSFSIAMWLSMTAMGLHTRNVIDDFSGLMIRIVLSFCLGFLGNTIVFYIYPDLFLGRGVFALSMMISFIGILFTRTVFQKLDKHKIFNRRILVLGVGSRAKILCDMNKAYNRQGYQIVGYIRSNEAVIEVAKENVLEIETTLVDLVLDKHIDEIVLAMDDRRQGFPVSGLLECKMLGVQIRDIVHFLERVTGHIELDVLHPSVMIFSSGFTKAVSPGNGKRLFDIFACSVILILTSPILIGTYLAIWLSSYGRDPVFYKQTRIGLSNVPFEVLKFRSMKVDAEKDGAQFAKKKDSRVTFIGAFIRKTRIDELPQLINVFKGDMSFVGPRPERPEFVLGFEHDIPHYSLRHTVKPGITGWAQICYPYGETIEDTRNKLQYDLYYIKNFSLFLDMTILFQTVQVVLFGQGAR